MKILISVLGVIVLSAVAWWSYNQWRDSALNDDPYLTWMKEGIQLSEFSLQDMDGKPFVLSSLQNRWSIVFFGYTSCPDICPTTMMTLKRMLRQVPSVYQNTQIVMISVDPQRDKLGRLKEYVQYYNKEFLGVRGDGKNFKDFLEQMGAYYQIDDPGVKNYHVSHTASLFFIHPQGKMVAALRPPHRVDRLSQIYIDLRDYYGG